MFCWHKWGRWSDPVNGIYGRTTDTGYFKVLQMRTCEKCGKAETRTLPNWRSIESLRGDEMTPEQLKELRKAAEEATPGPWMRLFGERTVYDRMEDGCRGNAIARADIGFSQQDNRNLDYIATANPATIMQLLDYVESLERDAARWKYARQFLAIEDIESWTGDEWKGHVPNENENLNADDAIDAAMGESK